MSELLKTIGNNVRRYRLKKNLTQAKLAKRAKLHRSYISHIEHAKRNIDVIILYKLAKALGVRARDLIK